jgi:hypothetical protein
LKNFIDDYGGGGGGVDIIKAWKNKREYKSLSHIDSRLL